MEGKIFEGQYDQVVEEDYHELLDEISDQLNRQYVDRDGNFFDDRYFLNNWYFNKSLDDLGYFFDYFNYLGLNFFNLLYSFLNDQFFSDNLYFFYFSHSVGDLFNDLNLLRNFLNLFFDLI